MSSQESQTRLVEYALLVCLHCLDQVVHVDRKQRHQVAHLCCIRLSVGTSFSLRFQFSQENAYTVYSFTPNSMHHLIDSRNTSEPLR